MCSFVRGTLAYRSLTLDSTRWHSLSIHSKHLPRQNQFALTTRRSVLALLGSARGFEYQLLLLLLLAREKCMVLE